MSFGKALYFPYIHFQNEDWLKYSLLYWDEIKRIVPPSYEPRDNDAVKELINAELIENVDPKPYTVGAAEEFIPTIKELLQERGNLGRGALISNGLKANAEDEEYVVHIQKMDEKVIKLLEESDLGAQHGDWLSMDGALAGYYMLCLAAHISEKQRAPLLSDSFEMETAGTFFQHSRIPPNSDEQIDEDVGFRLAKMVLPVPCPENLADIPMKKIIAFHRKYEAERMQFRQAIEKLATDAAGLDVQAAINDFLEEKKKIINNAIKDQAKTMDELGVDIVHSLFSISAPSALTAAATHFNPIAMTVAAGVGIAYSVISWFAKARGERRQKIRECDWHYLLRVEKQFDVKEIVSSAQNWMLQFIYD